MLLPRKREDMLMNCGSREEAEWTLLVERMAAPVTHGSLISRTRGWHNFTFDKILKIIYLDVYGCLTAFMPVCHVFAVPTEARRRCQIHWHWSYRWLRATTWVLEIESRFSERAANNLPRSFLKLNFDVIFYYLCPMGHQNCKTELQGKSWDHRKASGQIPIRVSG